jgi:putative ABC transport system permease protein
MNPLATIRVAIRALGRNVTRSVLTTLGIVIGVAAVIAMVAMGEGAKKQVEESFATMGTNLLIILPGASTSGGAMGGFGSQPTLTWDDLEAISPRSPPRNSRARRRSRCSSRPSLPSPSSWAASAS